MQQPHLMQYYDPDPHDAAPHVDATDRSAYNGSDVPMGHSDTVQEARNLRHMLENMTLDNKEGHGRPLRLERVAPVCEGTFPGIYHLMT